MGFLRSLLDRWVSGAIPEDRQTPVPRQQAPTPDGLRVANPLIELRERVRPFAHPNYPFNHAQYSPGSRVPCADFTSFIIDGLRQRRLEPVQALMREIITGNPGIGCGPDWIDQCVTEIAGTEFGQHVQSRRSDTSLELQALFILGSLGGGERPFLLTGEFPELCSWALVCDALTWLPAMDALREKANRFIRRMRIDTPFWQDFPLFTAADCAVPPRTSPLAQPLAALPISARIHLFCFALHQPGSLYNATTYAMRALGVNPAETVPVLLAAGFCDQSEAPESVAAALTKHQLLAALQEAGIAHRKGWKKSQLAAVLREQAADAYRGLAEQAGAAALRPEFTTEFAALREYASALVRPLGLLCFA